MSNGISPQRNYPPLIVRLPNQLHIIHGIKRLFVLEGADSFPSYDRRIFAVDEGHTHALVADCHDEVMREDLTVVGLFYSQQKAYAALTDATRLISRTFMAAASVLAPMDVDSVSIAADIVPFILDLRELMKPPPKQVATVDEDGRNLRQLTFRDDGEPPGATTETTNEEEQPGLVMTTHGRPANIWLPGTTTPQAADTQASDLTTLDSLTIEEIQRLPIHSIGMESPEFTIDGNDQHMPNFNEFDEDIFHVPELSNTRSLTVRLQYSRVLRRNRKHGAVFLCILFALVRPGDRRRFGYQGNNITVEQAFTAITTRGSLVHRLMSILSGILQARNLPNLLTLYSQGFYLDPNTINSSNQTSVVEDIVAPAEAYSPTIPMPEQLTANTLLVTRRAHDLMQRADSRLQLTLNDSWMAEMAGELFHSNPVAQLQNATDNRAAEHVARCIFAWLYYGPTEVCNTVGMSQPLVSISNMDYFLEWFSYTRFTIIAGAVITAWTQGESSDYFARWHTRNIRTGEATQE